MFRQVTRMMFSWMHWWKSPKGKDEVSDFRNARWWCPPRPFGSWLDLQCINKCLRLHAWSFIRKTNKLLWQLVQWFALNKGKRRFPCNNKDEGPSATDLLSTEIPHYYIWTSQFEWQRRKNFSAAYTAISRMFSIHVNANERTIYEDCSFMFVDRRVLMMSKLVTVNFAKRIVKHVCDANC